MTYRSVVFPEIVVLIGLPIWNRSNSDNRNTIKNIKTIVLLYFKKSLKTGMIVVKVGGGCMSRLKNPYVEIQQLNISSKSN